MSVSRHCWRCCGFSVLVCVAWLALVMSGCSESSSAPPVFDEAQLPPDESLKASIDDVLDYSFSQRALNTRDHAAWQVVHGILAFGDRFKIYHDEQPVVALDYLLNGGRLTGWNMRPGDRGLESILEAGTSTGQGHPDQWLGYLSQCGMKPDQKVVWAGKDYAINDLITQAQWNVYDGMEGTWTLMALSTYLPLNEKWTAKDGSEWTLERLAQMESQKNINEVYNSACGGAHRLYGLATAVNRYLQETNDPKGERLIGGWKVAEERIQQAISDARTSQNQDGTFSINYFSRPATSPDLAKQIGTTGHVLEFLTVALRDDELRQPWMTKAAAALTDLLKRSEGMPLECGALYHAAHGLQIYRLRRFPSDAPQQPQSAE